MRPGRYVETSTERIIYRDYKNRNKHEQVFNRMMERACEDLSRSNIKLKDERLLRMKYVTPPRHHLGRILHFTERRDV
jgi:trans-2-enoyl-CoA reductase